jgi:hypothetical protein
MASARAFVGSLLVLLLVAITAPASEPEKRTSGTRGALASPPSQPLIRVQAPSRSVRLPFGVVRLSRSTFVSGATEPPIRVTIDFSRATAAEELLVRLSRPALADSPRTGRNVDAFAANIARLQLRGARAGSRRMTELDDPGAPPGRYRLNFLERDRSGATRLTERAEIVVYGQHRLPPSVEPQHTGRAGSSETRDSESRALAGDEINHNLTNMSGNQAETYAAVQPNNPARVIAGVNPEDPLADNPFAAISDDFMRPGTVVVRELPSNTTLPSDEGGATVPLDLCCDPAFAADPLGNFWYSVVGSIDDPTSHIVVNRVAAGTNTFQASNTAIPRVTLGVQDKNMMTIDNSSTSPKFGTLYVVWTENPPVSGPQNIVISQCDTRPGGVSTPANCDDPDNWTEPVPITSSGGTYTYGSVATAPNGDVYVTWWDATSADPDSNAIEIDRCLAAENCAAAASWNEEAQIEDLDEMDDDGDGSADPFPFFCPIIAAPGGRVGAISYVDVGPDGTIYVAYSDLRNNGTTRCSDPPSATDKTFESFIVRGAAPNAIPPENSGVRLSDDTATAANDHFLPTLTVDQSTGEVQSNLYSTKLDSSGQTTHQFVVISTNGGVSYSAMNQITTASTDCSSSDDLFDYGDYEGADSAGGQLFPSWSDGRPDCQNMELYMLTKPAAAAGGGPPPTTPTPTTTTPTTTPTVPDLLAPGLVLRFARSYRIRVVIRRGVRGRVGCTEACTLRLRLLLNRRTARRLGIVSQRQVVIGRATVRLTQAATRRATIRLTRRARSRLRRARRVRVTLSVRAVDPAGNARTGTRRITLRR